MRAHTALTLLALAAMPLLGLDSVVRAAAPQPTPQPPALEAYSAQQAPGSGALEQAVQEALTGRQEMAAFQLNPTAIDHIETSADGAYALVYLAALDAETGEPLAREPELAIAKVAGGIAGLSPDGAQAQSLPSAWNVTLQSDEAWREQLADLPPELLNDELRQRFLSEPEVSAQTALTLGGYLLPWAGGNTKGLTWSVSHTSCSDNACQYAFDFADGSMFPLLAAKGGEVFAAQWSIPNGSTSGTNYLILKDNSTTPTSYQIYYHLAQSSIPEALRVKGAPVIQGQFIGNADDTGYSSGHHLHFMVHTSSYGYWGTSVDITFRDVSINYDPVTQGGRPRRTNEASWYGGQGQDSYTSGNYGANPPGGAITAPVDGLDLPSSSVHVEGWASDDLGITKAQLLVDYGMGWREAGSALTFSPPQKTANIMLEADLAAAGVPDGPVSLSLRVWDVEGNFTRTPLGVRKVFKHSGNPGSLYLKQCIPGTNQVALYSQPGYAGFCQLFNLASYSGEAALGAVGEDTAASVLIGSGVSATLFSDPNFTGRSETFAVSDPNLAEHRIGGNTVSALKVQSRSANPSKPVAIAPSGVTTEDSLVLTYQDTGGGEALDPKVEGPFTTERDFTHTVAWPIGSLPAGDYTYTVQARVANQDGYLYTTTSEAVRFSVTQAPVTTLNPTNLPFFDDFENGLFSWTASGAWSPASLPGADGALTRAWRFNGTGACVDGATCLGDLTSPPFWLAAGQTAYISFDYQYTGEKLAKFWDQRSVQVAYSLNPDGPYSSYDNRVVLYDDQPGIWLTSPKLDKQGGLLSVSGGSTGQYARLRFNFASVDGRDNAGSSWTVDNVRVNTTAPTGFTLDNNDTPEEATPIAVGSSAQGAINPGGEVDFYQFSAIEGKVYQVDVVSTDPTGKMDPVVAVMAVTPPTKSGIDASYFQSVIAENDDLVAGVDPNARVSFKAQTSGTYFIRVTEWSAPNGGPEYSYRLTLTQLNDTTPPSVSLNKTLLNGYLTGLASLSAQAADTGSGLRGVEFYIHLNDWEAGRWRLLGADWNPDGGWSTPINPATLPEMNGMGLWVRAYDWALNATSDVLYNVGNDHTAPTSALAPLPPTTPGTVFPVAVGAYDLLSGVERCEIEVAVDGGGWEPWGAGPGPGCSGWYIGQFGHTYAFRSRAVDRAGNGEAFPEGAETQTQLVDPGIGDGYEPDESREAARGIEVDAPAQTHDIYALGDQDWLRFEAEAGESYYVIARPSSNSPMGARLSLYDEAGVLLNQSQASGLGQPVTLGWVAAANASIYVQVQPVDARIAGSNAEYRLSVQTAIPIYMPLIAR